MAAPLLQLTDSAIERVKFLLQKRDKLALGIRVGVKSGGCSGLSYKFEYADEVRPHEEKIEAGGVSVFVEPTAVMYLIGTTMDFVDEQVRSGFQFTNPNEKAKCGCGKSFNV